MDKSYFIDNLDRAIKEEWIKAYHQPLVRAASGKVSDEEAYSRWIDPQMGTFTASEFVPALDEAKLTYKLDLYMVERVLKKMKEPSHDYYGVGMVFIDLHTGMSACKTAGKTALVIGSEGRGLSAEVAAMCDRTYYIPIKNVESLNAAVAAGILMFALGGDTD